MAANYVNLIRAHQPGGPYALLDYSFGGLIDTDFQAGALPLIEKLPPSLRQVRLACEKAFMAYNPPRSSQGGYILPLSGTPSVLLRSAVGAAVSSSEVIPSALNFDALRFAIVPATRTARCSPYWIRWPGLGPAMTKVRRATSSAGGITRHRCPGQPYNDNAGAKCQRTRRRGRGLPLIYCQVSGRWTSGACGEPRQQFKQRLGKVERPLERARSRPASASAHTARSDRWHPAPPSARTHPRSEIPPVPESGP